MLTQPTSQSADLMVRLFQVRTEQKLYAARQWFLYHLEARDMDEFHQLFPKPYFDDALNFQLVVSFWNMVAAFLTSNLLNSDLFFRSDLELLAIWSRIAHLVPHLREAEKNPSLYGELESAAQMARKFLDAQGPDAYEAFVATYRQMPSAEGEDMQPGASGGVA